MKETPRLGVDAGILFSFLAFKTAFTAVHERWVVALAIYSYSSRFPCWQAWEEQANEP
jgi:hypothetical protein